MQLTKLLRLVYKHFKFLGSFSLALFRNCPLHHWRLNQRDLDTLRSLLLCPFLRYHVCRYAAFFTGCNVLFLFTISNEHKLAVEIIDGLNWHWSEDAIVTAPTAMPQSPPPTATAAAGAAIDTPLGGYDAVPSMVDVRAQGDGIFQGAETHQAMLLILVDVLAQHMSHRSTAAQVESWCWKAALRLRVHNSSGICLVRPLELQTASSTLTLRQQLTPPAHLNNAFMAYVGT